MRHQDLTTNHILESFTYANAAARLAATGFVAGDVGRVAYQVDKGSYWRLTATTPTWQLIASATLANLLTATTNPTGTSALTPGVMMGLGGAPANAKITPGTTGKLLVQITGNITISSVNQGSVALAYGTGTAPVNGAAATGTQPGSVQQSSSSTAIPFSVSAIITGLTVGTQYWFDLVVFATSPATTTVTNVVVTVVELP